MHLSAPTVQTLLKTIDVCKLFGIEQFILEPSLIKGITIPPQVAIIAQCANDIECDAIAFNRLDILSKRLKLTDDTVIEYEVNGSFCNKLIIKSKKLKVEYNCANANLIEAPRELGINNLCDITIPEDLHQILNKGFSSIKTGNISILSDESQLMYKFVDETNEQFTYCDGDIVSDDILNFANNYDAKLFLKAIQKCDNNYFTVADRGVLIFQIDGLNVYMLPAR
jgi:hypothetical protein